MAIINHSEAKIGFDKDILEALNLSDKEVKSIDIHMGVDSLATIKVEFYGTEKLLNAVRDVFKKHGATFNVVIKN